MNKRFLAGVSIFITIVLIVSVILYFTSFGWGLSDNLDVWAGTGEFFGGVIGSLLTLLTILLLLYTNLEQNESFKRDHNIDKYLSLFELKESILQAEMGRDQKLWNLLADAFNAVKTELRGKSNPKIDDVRENVLERVFINSHLDNLKPYIAISIQNMRALQRIENETPDVNYSDMYTMSLRRYEVAVLAYYAISDIVKESDAKLIDEYLNLSVFDYMWLKPLYEKRFNKA